MSIDSPATYGDWYWKNSVDARMFENEEYEKELAPTIQQVMGGLGISDKLPSGLSTLFSNMTNPSAPAWASVMGRFLSETADGIVGQSLNHALKDFNYQLAEFFGDQRIDANQASILFQRRKISEGLFNARMASHGLKESEAVPFYESTKPYFSIPDIVLWSRYNSNPENIREELWKWFDVNPAEFAVWEWLGWQRLSTEQVQTLHRRDLISESELDKHLAQIGWMGEDRNLVKELSWLMPNPLLMVQAGLFNRASDQDIMELLRKSDIHPRWTSSYYDAVRTKPNTQDIIAYQLRQDPSLNKLEHELRRIGIHDEYTSLYKELAYPIPPVQDIITMAVREAFSPEVANRFGQYEDFPQDLEYWSERKGISKEWAERYWASHWSLPSVTQGFEMLHRGIITEDELKTLLRALDVMPFWRDRLIELSYKPLTRVDVRRMYKEGVLTEQEVVKAYLDIGYNEDNAKRMALFTVRQTLSSQAKFSSTDVIRAYTKFVIDRNDATGLLRELGIRSEDANYMINLAEHKREWEVTETKIEAVRNLYKKSKVTENQARDSLLKLDLPSNQVDALMDKWYYEPKEEEPPTWTTAQTIKFAKDGKITRARAIQELQLIGYDNEHINVYMSGIE